jgi:hypothetical protein
MIKTKGYHSETVKMALKGIPVIDFLRLITKMYSVHSIAVIQSLKPIKVFEQ